MEIFDWDSTAGGNGFAAPDGFPEGMNYSDVNNAAREIMAVLNRWYRDTSGQLVTAGTGTAYTLTAARTLSGYADGQMFRFRAHAANTGSATINISGQGAATLYRPDGTTLDGNEIKINGVYEIAYSSGLGGFVLSATGVAASVANRGEVELATDAEAIAMAAADRAVTPENLDALNLWTDARYFESAEFSMTSAVFSQSFTHGLGVKPKLVELVAICKVADGGYAVGDEFALGYRYNIDGFERYRLGVNWSSTVIRVVKNAHNEYHPESDGNGEVNLTSANFKFKVRAFA